MGRCPQCGSKECCGADLEAEIERLRKALQDIHNEGIRGMYDNASGTELFRMANAFAVRALKALEGE